MDIIKVERAKERFLMELYQCEATRKTEVGQIITENTHEIAKRAGLTELEAERVGDDLAAQRLIQSFGGWDYALTTEGRLAAEQILHEATMPWLAKVCRKLKSPAVTGALAGLIAALIVNVLSASDIPWWIKLFLGRR